MLLPDMVVLEYPRIVLLALALIRGAHSGRDRAFGCGLKYASEFNNHLLSKL